MTSGTLTVGILGAGKVGTVLGMSALVVDYGKMQRELFTILERCVVLNDTAFPQATPTSISRMALCWFRYSTIPTTASLWTSSRASSRHARS